jgi:hypothetical protein
LLICLDQKTGIQAIERLFPDKLVKPGHIKKREHSYIRHGTKNLIGGLVVATGEVFAKFYFRNRNFELCNYLTHAFNKFHYFEQIHVIADNYGTHTHLNTCLLVAKFCGIKISKNELQTKQQRIKFLSSKNKWIVFHFLPTHASWLNQMEIWFSIFTRKAIKKGSFSSLENMVTKLTNYIEVEWNQKNAKPFQWTYKGKVCHA